MNIKWNIEKVKVVIESESEHKCELLSKQYISTKSKLKIRCVCENVFLCSLDNFKKKKHKMCNKCTQKVVTFNMTKTHTQFLKDFYAKHEKDPLIVVGKYTNNNTKIRISCKKHGDFYALPTNLLSGKSCRECSLERGFKPKIEHQHFIQEIKSIYGDQYEPLESYKGATTKIKFYCIEHGMFRQTPSRMKSGHSCPYCSGSLRMKKEDFISLIKHKQIKLTGEYERASKKAAFQCEECFHMWETRSTHIINGHGCPNCASSKGEKIIHKYLQESKTTFTFNRRIMRKPVINKRFDFYIKDDLAVEYDGEGHFQPTDFAGKGKEWAIQSHQNYIKRDKFKNQYCIDNNIPLIRIPYWEFDNIEYILDNILKYFNIIEGECEDPSIVEKHYVKDGWCHDTYISWNDKENRNIKTNSQDLVLI